MLYTTNRKNIMMKLKNANRRASWIERRSLPTYVRCQCAMSAYNPADGGQPAPGHNYTDGTCRLASERRSR